MKFKLGQTVEVIKNTSDSCNKVGDIGKIVKVDNDSVPYRVLVEGRYNYGVDCFHRETDLRKTTKKAKSTIVVLKLNDDYTATVNSKKKTVEVGCQTFTFKKIQELAKLCKVPVRRKK